MYEFTCPRCAATSRVKGLGGDAATPCPNCSQFLRLVPEETAEAPRLTHPAWWESRVFLGICGAGGLAAIGLVVLLFVFLARRPLNASDEPAALEDNPELELRAERPRGKAPARAPVARKPAPPEPLEKVLPGLESTNVGVREHAARRLAAIGPPARVAVPKLLTLLRGGAEPESVRRSTEEALRAIGPPRPEDASAVAEALQDTSCETARRYAAEALGGAGDPAQAPALAKALGDPDAQVRARAAASLGRLGPSARGAGYEPLLSALRDPEPRVRGAALVALPRLGNPDRLPAALPRLLADTSAPTEARLFAARAAASLGAGEVPALAAALKAEKDPAVGVALARALGSAAANDPGATAALTGALDHSEKSVRVVAAQSLRDLPLGRGTLPGILKALQAADPDVRRAALRGLPVSSLTSAEAAAGLGADSVQLLRPALASPAPEARLFAAASLGRLGTAAAPAAAELRRALSQEKDSSPVPGRTIRLEVLAAVSELGPDALASLGPDGEGFLAELKDAAADADDSNQLCRTAASLALVKLAAADQPAAKVGAAGLAKALLLHNCTQPDVAEQALHERARRALVKYSGKLAGPALAREYDVLLDDGPRVRSLGVPGTTPGFPVGGPGRPPRPPLGGMPRGGIRQPGVPGTPVPSDAAQDKQHARKVLFQVLEEVGPAARCNAVRTMFEKATVRMKSRQEAAEVNEAAQAAYNAIYKKR